MKIGNVLFKGLKVGAQILAGGAAFGAFSVATGWHPPHTGSPLGDTLLPILWNTVGTGAVTALGAALARWSTYDPRLDPRNRPLQ